MPDKEKYIDEFEVVDHGMNASDYFPGIGTSSYDEVVVGVGSNPKEAWDDAIEQIPADIDTYKLDEDAGDHKESPNVMYKVSLQFDYEMVDEEDGGEPRMNIKGDGSVDSDVDLRSSTEFHKDAEVEDDGSTIWISYWDNSPDSAAERVLEIVEEKEYPVSSRVIGDLKKMARMSEPNMYYYIGIRYSLGSPQEISFLVKKLDLYGKDSGQGIHLKDPDEGELTAGIEDAMKDNFDKIIVYSDKPEMVKNIESWIGSNWDDVEVVSNSSGVVAVWH